MCAPFVKQIRGQVKAKLEVFNFLLIQFKEKNLTVVHNKHQTKYVWEDAVRQDLMWI